MAEQLVADDEPSPAWSARWGDYSPVALYRLRVVTVFKGKPGPDIRLFQEVTSARFPLDQGKEYLLFLHYYRGQGLSGTVTRGATYVRYNCGPSKPWNEVSRSDLAEVRELQSRTKFSRR